MAIKHVRFSVLFIVAAATFFGLSPAIATIQKEMTDTIMAREYPPMNVIPAFMDRTRMDIAMTTTVAGAVVRANSGNITSARSPQPESLVVAGFVLLGLGIFTSLVRRML